MKLPRRFRRNQSKTDKRQRAKYVNYYALESYSYEDAHKRFQQYLANTGGMFDHLGKHPLQNELTLQIGHRNNFDDAVVFVDIAKKFEQLGEWDYAWFLLNYAGIIQNPFAGTNLSDAAKVQHLVHRDKCRYAVQIAIDSAYRLHSVAIKQGKLLEMGNFKPFDEGTVTDDIDKALRAALQCLGFNMRTKAHRNLPWMIVYKTNTEGQEAANTFVDQQLELLSS